MRAEHRRPLVASIIVAIACAVVVGNGFREKAVQQLIEHGVPVMVLAPLAPDVIVTAEQGARASNPQPSRAKAMATLALAGLSTPKPTARAQVTAVPISTEAVVLADRPASPVPPARHHTVRHQAARHPSAPHHAATHPTNRHHAQPAVKAHEELSATIQHAVTRARHPHGHLKAASARIRHLADSHHSPSHARGHHRTSPKSEQHRAARHSHGGHHGHSRGHGHHRGH